MTATDTKPHEIEAKEGVRGGKILYLAELALRAMLAREAQSEVFVWGRAVSVGCEAA